MTPNWDAVQEALRIALVATPFMFGTLALFALTMVGLSYLKDPSKKV